MPSKAENIPLPSRIKWTPLVAEKFSTVIHANDFSEKMHSLMQDCQQTNPDSTIDELTESFTNSLIEAAEIATKSNVKHKPHRKGKSKHFTPELRRLRNSVIKKNKLLDQNPFDKSIRNDFYLLLKKYRKLNKQCMRVYKQDLLNKMKALKYEDPKTYWKLLEQLENVDKTKSNPAENITCEDWESYFAKLNSSNISDLKQAELLNKLSLLEEQKVFNSLDYIITKDEILLAVKSQKVGKATGLDSVCSEMIKQNLDVLMDPLYALFKLIFSKGHYPKQWVKGFIIPIFKKANPANPSNYRGIAITSHLSKIFNFILNKRLVEFIEKNNIMSDFQIGFKKGSRTSDHIFTLKTLIDKYVKKMKKPLYTCFVDFQKAFDRVWHNALFYKLKTMGVSDKFYAIIKSMYSQTEMAVRVGSTLTSMFPSNIGIRQGDILSPLLFNLFINELPLKLQASDINAPVLVNRSVPCLLYADDLILLSLSKSGLQASLNLLSRFCDEWGLDINVSKSKIMTFVGNGHLMKNKFTCCGVVLECVHEYTYLGIVITASGTFTKAKRTLTGKGLKSYFKLARALGNNYSHVDVGLHVFDHTVRPILLYGSEIWGACDFTKASIQRNTVEYKIEKAYTDLPQERLNLRICKFLLGLPQCAPSDAVRGELGRFPLYIDIICNMLKYWVRLEKLQQDHFLKEVYQCNVTMEGNSWTTSIQFILEELGLSSFWANKPTNNYVVNRARTILKSRYEKMWQGLINNDVRKAKSQKNKLRTYRKFKLAFEFEEYISNIKNIDIRSCYVKFRTSCHKLHIETGRTTKGYTPVSERFCNVCKSGVIEDEEHFLLECPIYKDLRNRMMVNVKGVFPGANDLDKGELFIWLMASRNYTVYANLAYFVQKAMTLRQSILNPDIKDN